MCLRLGHAKFQPYISLIWGLNEEKVVKMCVLLINWLLIERPWFTPTRRTSVPANHAA